MLQSLVRSDSKIVERMTIITGHLLHIRSRESFRQRVFIYWSEKALKYSSGSGGAALWLTKVPVQGMNERYALTKALLK